MNTRIFISESVIYKRSWLDWLRGKVFADMDSTPLTKVYYMVDGVIVGGDL